MHYRLFTAVIVLTIISFRIGATFLFPFDLINSFDFYLDIFLVCDKVNCWIHDVFYLLLSLYIEKFSEDIIFLHHKGQ